MLSMLELLKAENVKIYYSASLGISGRLQSLDWTGLSRCVFNSVTSVMVGLLNDYEACLHYSILSMVPALLI